MTFKAYAKVNIFLKITGVRGPYHELRSRFVRVDSLFDSLTFSRKKSPAPGFELISSVPLPRINTLTRAYELLKEAAPGIEKFFETHKVILEKRIPQGAGLGGGSSDAAAFLNACNELYGLHLSKENLARIGEKIGADVPFFVHGYASANVEGVGERIEPFEEDVPKLQLLTPPLHCDTGLVYRAFREHFIQEADREAAASWKDMKSDELLKTLDPVEANDLYKAALTVYPRLHRFATPNRFFSGSGSTFFHLPEQPSSRRVQSGQ
ncbi:4-(cytidine 5'-diphospho)-2-C-methyl-D-erythritol kinase [Hydrogenimonas urashimensis]|uniref:4-(cytidine 5'-diphospho)-2-C-methyl-D-erythritol kinase n=1 Tax=Hydrogenimonas urashimensis TaxID=2740515 RepID=UPI00191523CF|nr:4-(cytidine 5'-diphospho)-2-C-methyl-D-erythritol kinase [Hydrogenimonas urashimensis]